jgi:hypothetical protein
MFLLLAEGILIEDIAAEPELEARLPKGVVWSTFWNELAEIYRRLVLELLSVTLISFALGPTPTISHPEPKGKYQIELKSLVNEKVSE